MDLPWRAADVADRGGMGDEWIAGEDGRALVVQRFSLLGLGLGLTATGALALWSLIGTVDEVQRDTYHRIVAVMTVLLAVWALAYRWSSRGRVWEASVINLFSAAAASALFVAIDGGAVLGTITTVAALTAASLLFEGRALQLTGLIGAGSLVLSLALHEMGVLGGLTIPRPLLIGATGAAVVIGLPAMIAVFRLYSRSLAASREQALAAANRLADGNRRLATHTRELQDLAAGLERRDAEIRDFLFVAAHDLRAPVINMSGFSQVMAEAIESIDGKLGDSDRKQPPSAEEVAELWGDAREEIDDCLGFIAANTVKMEGLVNGLLELSRIDNDIEDSETLEIEQLVGELVAARSEALEDRAIEVQVGSLPHVVGDRARVQQIFANLVDNAIKFMPAEGERRIEIGARESDAVYEFYVRDTGAGIRAEDHQRIFRPFARLNPKQAPGQGMGLAAARKIVERRRCRIWVESAPGAGSVFFFTWPIPRDTDLGTSQAA